jgi:hypothetical protein
MLPTLMRRVINCFQAVGPQEKNAVLLEMVAKRLRAQRLRVITKYCIRDVVFNGRQTHGLIDMAIVDDGIAVGVEVDRLTPRDRSILKLRASQLQYTLVVLTHPRASEKMPITIAGIDAVVALRRPNFSGSQVDL